MLSDKTREALGTIRDTLKAGIAATDAVVDVVNAAGVDTSTYPAAVIHGIGGAIIDALPEMFEQAADAIGFDEHITVEVPEKGVQVTGTITR